MPPKKRRVNASPKERKSTPSTKSNSLATLLEEIQLLSRDKTRCSQALQALVDGKCSFGCTHDDNDDDDPKTQPLDCYWIILATHTIHRLTKELLTNETKNEKVALVLSMLAHGLSTVLLNDRPKLEKCASATASEARLARSVVGRAIVAITIGATAALEHSKSSKSLWACCASLEAVVHLSLSSSTKEHDFWNGAQERIKQEMHSTQEKEEEACLAVMCALKFETEQACVAALLKKPTRRSRKKDALQLRFQALLDQYEANAIVMDGRVSIRRWASMAFVWLCRGQERVLDVVIDWLSHSPNWTPILDCPALSGKRVPGNVALVALASRLIDVVSESGNACGVRAPTGGMDAYAATFAAQRSPKTVWTRPDVRHAATVASYWLIQAHAECMETNCPEEHLLEDGDADETTARYYPYCHKTLDTLCHAAASSVVSSASVDVSDSIRRLLGIASAFGLAVPKVNVKLAAFGICHLSESLRSLLSDDENSVGGSDTQDFQQQYEVLAEKYSLQDPLPVPAVPKAVKSRKKKNDSAVCTFGGVFAPPPRGVEQGRISDEELLSLHLRAMACTYNNNDKSPAQALLARLMEIVQCAYDTPIENKAEQQETTDSSSSRTRAGSKKRTARKAGGKAKRRKVGKDKEDATEQVVNDVNAEATANTTNRKAISAARAGLATDANNALRMCLFHPQTHGSTRCSLRLSLRRSLTTQDICEFVQLGQLLDEVLIKARIVSKRHKGSTEFGRGPSLFFSASGSGDFTHVERCLWISHINLCETLGRGHTSYDPRRQSSATEPILGDAARRLAVFRAIATCGKDNSEGGIDQWPLYLPAVHHALVASNLTSEPFQSKSDDTSPERFIADSFVSSIASALDDLTLIDKWHSSHGDEYVPLSLRDARLFVLAVCRLQSNEQKECLSKLIDVLFSFLSSIKSNESTVALITSNAMFSGFLARVITTCVTLVNTIFVAPSLREALFLQVGPTQYQLPALTSSARKLEDSLDSDAWYTRERCFMGLFSDWQSPTIPEVPLPDSPIAINREIVRKLNVIFETLLHLGFSSANNDKCHLLFAAWNASGNARAWDKTKPENRKFDGASVTEDQFPQLLMELRDDMCRSHREIHGNSGAIPDSLLSSVLQRRDKGKKASKPKVKDILKKMLSKAESLVDSLALDSSSQIEKLSSSTPLATFALFEAISVYISFIVAEQTKAGNDFFSNGTQSGQSQGRKDRRSLSSGHYDDDEILARARASILSDDSGESDGDFPDFDDDFDEDARISAMARLHDACVQFGASPAHPDWLDESCRMREVITTSEAVEIAEAALKCLNKLASFAYARSMQLSFEALKKFTKRGPGRERHAALALQLCFTVRNENVGESTDKSDELLNDIARVCQVEKKGLELLLGNTTCHHNSSTKGAWCPNSAQRILGKLQDRRITIDGWDPMQCELRAGGEWELLLGACLDLDLDSPSALQKPRTAKRGLGASAPTRSREGSNPEQFCEAGAIFLVAERWQRVCESVIGNIMPAAALLRFGLGGGTGRKPHPLNTKEPYSAEGTGHTCFTETLPSPAAVPEQIKSLVPSIVALLSELSSTCHCDSVMKRLCSAAATNIMVDPKSFGDIVGMKSLRIAFTALFALRDMSKDEKLRRKESASLRLLVERLVLSIEARGNCHVGETTDRSMSEAVPSSPNFRSASGLGFVRLLGFLGFSSVLKLESIVGTLEPMSLLSSTSAQAVCSQLLLNDWQGAAAQERAISEMVSLFCRNELNLNVDTRCRLSRILAAVSELEYGCLQSLSSSRSHPPVLLHAITAAFNSLGDDCLKNLVKNDMCLVSSLPKEASLSQKEIEISKMVCLVFAFLLGAQSGGENLPKQILFTLLESIDQWSDHREFVVQEHVLDLLFLLGTRFDALVDIGSKLLSDASLQLPPKAGMNSSGLIHLEHFFRFIRDTNRALEKPDDTISEQTSLPDSRVSRAASGSSLVMQGENTHGKHNEDDSKASNTDTLCSYAQQKSFRDQHWYNCYTCGLMCDRGCCSICARICHRGHDVGYSRYSSFFCDCGAESADANEQGRVSCKCLTPLPSEQAVSIVGEEVSTNFFKIGRSDCALDYRQDSQQVLSTESNPIETKLITIALGSFKSQARSSVLNLRRKANELLWSENLFGLVRRRFDFWNDKITDTVDYGEPKLPSDRHPTSASFPGEYLSLLESLRDAVHTRKGKVLDLKPLTGRGMVPVRAAKANFFKMNLSPETSTDRLKRAMLAKHEIRRVAVAADSRGRLIIAEPSSLLFCSAFPAVNVRHVKNSCEEPLARRAQMCILGSSSLNFSIVGMNLCRENERHLVVWGTEEACFIVLSPLCDRVEKSIDLVFDLEPEECEIDYLLKCEWLPGSQTHVAVACGPFIKIFSVERAENESRLLPSTCYSLANEAALRDIAMVPISGKDGQVATTEEHGTTAVVKLFLLLDSGHIHVLDLNADSNGERYLEPSTGIPLPTTGVRLYHGASPSAPDSISRGIGEGSTNGLSYLSQSGLLLYSCVSSCVMALMFDAEGDVSGSFELLPHVISSDVLGTGSNGYSITGPYTHWTELGIVEEEDESFSFRVACVGKSSKTGQPRLVCVEFNHAFVKVRELSWVAGNSMGLGLSLFSSFDGLAAFSAPVMTSESCDPALSDNAASWNERAFLAAVTSNGAMLFFGEETCTSRSVVQGGKLRSSSNRRRAMSDSVVDRARIRMESSINTSVVEAKPSEPSFPLRIFETLTNASDFADLSYGGDGVVSDSSSIKTQLSSKTSVFFMTHLREGCTITISLKAPISEISEASGSDTRRKSGTRGEVAIVALRMLVGSTTTESIPRRISIEGRTVELKAGLKRWYDLPLTHEEVALGIRNGFVSLGIGPPFDVGNNSRVDAVEVFVTERENISSWLPKRLSRSKFFVRKRQDCGASTDESTADDDVSERRRNLDLSVLATTHMCEVLGSGDKGVADSSRGTLERLIQKISVAAKKEKETWDCVINLLEAVEVDTDARQFFLNKNIVYGLAQALNSAGRIFDEAMRCGDYTSGHGTQDSKNCLSSLASWACVKSLFRECCTTGARIAKSHPDTYMRSNEKMISDGSSTGSIAVDAWKLFERGTNASMDVSDLIPGLVNVTLTELANASDDSEKYDMRRFAKFGTIANLLQSPDIRIVESVCAAISVYVSETSFVRRKGGEKEDPQSPLPISAERNEQSAPIAYQCDSCSLFPITDSRYTLLEGDHDIDLCKDCFWIGRDFSQIHASDVDVVIRGKTLRLGETSRLTCAQIKQMQPVPIARNIEEQVEQARRVVNPTGEVPLQKALRKNIEDLGDVQSDFLQSDAGESELNTIQQAKQEHFADNVFTDILADLLSAEKIESLRHPLPLFQLVLGIVFNSGREDIEVRRAKQLAKELSHRVSQLLKLCSGGDASNEEARRRELVLVMCLQSLSSLVLQKHDEFGLTPFTEKDDPDLDVDRVAAMRLKDKTDPRFVCDVHGVPAVRRRCSRGVDKDRRFYVCGLERKLRCKYFKWADADEAGSDDASVSNSFYRGEMERYLWNILSSPISVDSVPLHAQLCEMLQMEFPSYEASHDAQVCRPSEVKSNGAAGSSDTSCRLGSLYDHQTSLKDLNDGVICSRQKLRVWRGRFRARPGNPTKNSVGLAGLEMSVGPKSDSSLIESSLELLALVAEDCTQVGAENESVLKWFSILCEIMSSSSSSHFRALAKRALKRLCGSRRIVYHSVRDYYVFGFQFDKLIKLSQGALEESILRKEQARQCGTRWRTGEVASWKNLRAGSLIGTQDLLSEDCLSLDCIKKISSVLDELLDVTRNRCDNWKQFCGLSSLPRSRHNKKASSDPATTLDEENESLRELLQVASNGPPILSLFWVACSLSGDSQIKAFTLIDAALNPSEQRSPPAVANERGEAADDGIEALSSDGGMDMTASRRTTQKNPFFSGDNDTAPEDALLGSHRGLTCDDIHAFIMQFVYRGKTTELRKVASHVAQSLCWRLSHDELGALFLRLVGAPLRAIGIIGIDSFEFLELLQGVVRHCQVPEQFERGAPIAMQCFTRQMQSLKQDPDQNGVDSVVLEGDIDGKLQRKRFDLACCVHCHRQSSASPSSTFSGGDAPPQGIRASTRNTRFVAPDDACERGNSSAASSREERNESPWLPDQVKPFVRGRLESSTEASVSTEFAQFLQLKFRLAVSNIFVSVNDPRGRFVKTIAVYFTPRQVNDVGVLKTAEYSGMWQRCATISLTRGASRASCSLSVPVVAANLKFEYLEFYDKPGGSTRSADGSLLLHCPRCTRVVNNAHGVCGNCGEVAFQCRKCRHINYDRLDAFLCVECGYCSCGGFGYELTAGIASNSVAIVDEDAFNRAVKILRVATKLHEDLRNSVRNKVNATKVRKRSRGSDLDALLAHAPALKRAFLGQLPTSGSRKGDSRSGGRVSSTLRGSAVASIASSKRADAKSRVSAANKARSLLRLARQLRSDNAGTSERSRSGDFFVRQAFLNSGRGLLVEDIEDNGDMLGIINSTDGIDVLPMDSSDSLSRLVASIQSRRDSSGRDRDENDGGTGEGGGGGDGGSRGNGETPNDSSPKALMEECDRLYQLMREAERECFEVQRRIDAWKRLEIDALADYGSLTESTMAFTATSCSVCSGPVTIQLLSLVMDLFQTGMSNVEGAVTKDFVRALFEEPANMSKDLFDLKRLAIKTLATKSERGGRLVLSELKLRLQATHDVASAEILGELLQSDDFSLVDEYVQLAMETAANST